MSSRNIPPRVPGVYSLVRPVFSSSCQGAPFPPAGGAQFDLLAIWSQVEQIPRPKDQFVRPSPLVLLTHELTPIPAHIPAPTPRPSLHAMPTAPKGMDTFLDELQALELRSASLSCSSLLRWELSALLGSGLSLIILLALKEKRRRGRIGLSPIRGVPAGGECRSRHEGWHRGWPEAAQCPHNRRSWATHPRWRPDVRDRCDAGVRPLKLTRRGTAASSS